MSVKPLRVLCIDDHAFIAEGLKSRFALEPDLVFAGWLASTDDAVAEMQRLRADVVLLDIDLPGSDPFDLLVELRQRASAVKVIVLSGHVRDQHIDAAVEAGWGFVSKRDTPDELVSAIRRAAAGEFALGPRVLERRQSPPLGRERKAPQASRLDRLTPRELQLLRMIGKGLSRIEIAKLIHRSPKTVDNHRTAIMEKLGIHDRVELARFAIREGLIMRISSQPGWPAWSIATTRKNDQGV